MQSGLYAIKQATGIRFTVLGTVDSQRVLLEGDVVDVVRIETVGYNTRITFSVHSVHHLFVLTREGKVGNHGYVDFPNCVRHELPLADIEAMFEKI